MAVNDMYTTHKCKTCGSSVKEIPLYDTWGFHILSSFECTNKDCNIKINEFDDVEIDDFIDIKTHYVE